MRRTFLQKQKSLLKTYGQAELQADFSLNYKSSTSRPQKIKCLETNYNDLANLDLISERQVVLERDFDAKTVYQNGWKKLVDNQITNLQDGKITYFYPGLPGNIDNLELLRNDKVELDNALKLFAERILGNNDINSLPTDQEIEGVYEESKVEVIKYSELKGFKRGRKLELFKTAFEGNTPSGITDNNEH
ncbi:39431_t:CDS:2 [Gigaspora margarita]|uniref:39431_t:CDS:1 n=1 Tax=Gigaspora margarita TaxID=4874 RepID=A0ABN7UR98_GIGMA|nr:39431_t:CDS:2 [Gigaspora margarita]